MGSSADDAKEIKNHPFFKNIDWDMLLKKKLEPPYKPVLNGKKDLSHFSKVSLYLNLNYSIIFHPKSFSPMKTQRTPQLQEIGIPTVRIIRISLTLRGSSYYFLNYEGTYFYIKRDNSSIGSVKNEESTEMLENPYFNIKTSKEA